MNILNFSNKEETKLEEFAMKLKESFLNSQIRKFRWIILNDYPSCLIGDFLTFVKKEKIMDEILLSLKDDEEFQKKFILLKKEN